MAFYLELKRSVLVLRNYYSKIWENTGITTDAESVDDTKTLPVIEGERRKAKGEKAKGKRKSTKTKRKRKSTKLSISMGPKKNHHPNISYVNVKVTQTSGGSLNRLNVRAFTVYRLRRLIRFVRLIDDDDCYFSTPKRVRTVSHRLTDVELKDRGE